MKKPTEKAMRAEAVERMRILGIDDDITEQFLTRRQVMVTDQQLLDADPEGPGKRGEITPFFPNGVSVNGRRYLIFTATPSMELQAVADELESRQGVTVYHILRIERNHDDEEDNMATYAFFAVTKYVHDWESERKDAAKGLPYAYVSTFGFPPDEDSLEYGIVPVKPYLGCLVATNVV